MTAILRTDDGAVRTLTLNRPEALNALTPALLAELAEALGDAATDDSDAQRRRLRPKLQAQPRCLR